MKPLLDLCNNFKEGLIFPIGVLFFSLQGGSRHLDKQEIYYWLRLKPEVKEAKGNLNAMRSQSNLQK